MDPYGEIEMLCIGGVLDGTKRKGYGPVLEAPVLRPLAESYADFAKAASPSAVPMERRDLYRRENLSFGQGNYIHFWRLDTLPIADAVRRVFENYKP
jgi:hypothetical protein